MEQFFRSQLDFIFFIYGLSFLWLGVVCMMLPHRTQWGKIWIWLGLFGFAHGLNEWMDLLVIAFGENPILELRGFVGALSFMFLLEFGRAGIAHTAGNKGPGRIWLIPFIGFALMGLLGGAKTFNVTARYSLGLVGGIASALALWRFAKEEKGKQQQQQQQLAAAGIGMFVYALATGLVVPRVGFFPANVINQEAFFSTLHFPVQLLRGIAATVIATSIWFYYVNFFKIHEEGLKKNIFISTYLRSMPWALVLLLLGTWAATDSASRHEWGDQRRLLSHRTTALADSIMDETVINKMTGISPGAEVQVDRGRFFLRRDIDEDFFRLCLFEKIKGELVLLEAVSPKAGAFFHAMQQPDECERINPRYREDVLAAFDDSRQHISEIFSNDGKDVFFVITPLRGVSLASSPVILSVEINAQPYLKTVSLTRLTVLSIAFALFFFLVVSFTVLKKIQEITWQTFVSEGILRRLSENMQDVVAEMDLEGNFSYLSPSVRSVLGYEPQAWEGKNVFPILAPEAREYFSKALHEVSVSGLFAATFRILHADRRYVWIEATGRSVLDEKGVRSGVIASWRDISDRRKAEALLRENEKRLRIMFEQAAVGVAQVSISTGRFIEVNKKYADILGYAQEEMERMTFSNVTHPDDLRGKLENLALLCGGKRSGFTLEKRFLHKNGSIVWGMLTVSPLWTGTEKPEFLLEILEDVTERKIAEEQLRSAKLQQEAILDNIPHSAWLKDKDGRYTAVNKAFERMVGMKSGEIIGRTDFDIWPRELADKQREADIRVMSLRNVERMEEMFTSDNGEVIWTEVERAPVFGVSGEVFGMTGVSQDITSRKNEQILVERERDIQRVIGQLLKLSLEDNSLEDYLRQALDLVLAIPWFSLESRGSIFLVGEDPTTLVMKVQKGLSDYIKMACQLIPFGKCHCGKAAATKQIEFASTVTGRHEIHYEGMIPHGHYCVPIIFGEKIVGVLNTYVRENYKNDEATERFLWMITNALAGAIERKKAEEALRKAHEELETRVRERTAELSEMQDYNQQILATITDYIYTVTVKDGVAVATVHQPTCRSVTGYTTEEFKAQPDLWERMVPDEDRSMVREFSAMLLAGKNTQPLEHRIRRKDGGIRWVRNTPVYHHDASGRLTSYDGIISDISDWKHAEILLIESMERVDRANRAKSQFLANMSHEVRTPLNAIIGFTDLLKTTNLEPIQKEYVGMLREGGEILLSLVTDVLDFSKMSAGEVRLEKINFDLEYLIQSILRIHIAKLKKKDPRIFCTIDEKVPHGFLGDPTRIRQVLMNLVSNAIKFTEKGEVEVRVTLDEDRGKTLPENQVMVRIAVRDTGIGVPQNKHKAIFDAFEQADVSTTRKYGGTGLGLSISKGLVSLMGGTIELESQPGKGSTFSFVLPLEVQPSMEEMQIVPLRDKDLEGKTILILDDDENVRMIFDHYCKAAGMVVSGLASSAQDALKWLSEQSSFPDVILVDIVMPGLDGYQVAEKMRKNKKYDNIKLIAVTGDLREGSASKAQESGFDGFVSKPTSGEDLLRVVKTVLGDKREKMLPAEIVTQQTAAGLEYKGSKILVVEDNPASQELLSIILKNFGFEIEIASDGREAVEKVREHGYALVLMDLQMPVMGGVEATKIIREQLKRTMPILALTAGVSEDDKEKCLAAGMNDYLMKPIEINKLKDKLFHWLKGIS